MKVHADTHLTLEQAEESTSNCTICLEKAALPYLIHQGESQNATCQKCLQQTLKIQESQLATCPACRKPYTYGEVLLILGNEEGRKYYRVFERSLRLRMIESIKEQLRQGSDDEMNMFTLTQLKHYLNYTFEEVLNEFLVAGACILAAIGVFVAANYHPEQTSVFIDAFPFTFLVIAASCLILAGYNTSTLLWSLSELQTRSSNFAQLKA